MFNIYKTHFGGESFLIKIVNDFTGEYFSFLPDHGASMNQLVLKGGNGEKYNLLYENTDYENLLTEGRETYKGSKLFPFPNRINSGEYSYQEKNYKLIINHEEEGHAIHGLVFDRKFNIISEDSSAEKGEVILEYDFDKESTGYPFKFNIKIIFRLDKNGFTCSTIVRNEDVNEIPIGDGWHPYFKTSSKINDAYLSIPSMIEIETDIYKIPTGKLIENTDFIEPSIIGEKKLDTCFQLFEDTDRSTIKIRNSTKSLDINIWMDSGFRKYKYVQIYTPDSRDCIAIEPMTCAPDAFNNKKDLILLVPKEELKLSWGVYLKRS